MESAPQNNSLAVKGLDISNKKKSSGIFGDGINNLNAEKERKHVQERSVLDSEAILDIYEIKLCSNKKIKINKSLLTFRITQFIWYGGGCIPSVFLGVFLKQKGLSLVELSSVFSMVFIFQFACSSITGIIADKIGNAKPVLMFLMFSTTLVLFSMLLVPNISSKFCNLQEKEINNYNLVEYNENFSSCYINCLFVYKTNISNEENHNKNSLIENVTLVGNKNDSKINNRTSACNLYNTTVINTSFDSHNNACCNACANSTKVDCVAGNNVYLVMIHAILILAFYSVYSTTYRFMNFSAISLAKRNESNFGKEIALTKFAELLFIILTAFVLNFDKSSTSDINFNPVMWTALGIIFCAFVISFTITAPIVPPGENLLKKAFNLVKDVDTLALILLAFISGNGYAFYFTFHLIFLEALNTPSIVVTLHSVAIVLYCFLLLLTSKWWMNKLGVQKIFVLALFFNGVNFAAYSYLYNPWWSLIIDTSTAFAFDLYWIAVIEHCWSLAPSGFAATYIALTGTVQYGIGRSSGVFFGGMLMNYLGPRKAYRIMGVIYFVATILYSIFAYKRRKLFTS